MQDGVRHTIQNADAMDPTDGQPMSPRVRGEAIGVRVLILGWCLWLLGTWIVLWAMGGWTMPALRVMVVSGLVGLMGVWPAVRLSQPTMSKPRAFGKQDQASADHHALTGTEVPEPRGEVSAQANGEENPGGGREVAGGGEISGGQWAGACRGVLVDWVALNLVFQVVIWPLQLSAGWTLGQAVWLDVAVAGWSLLTGLVIAWGRGTDRPGLRNAAMVVCVAVVVLEPALWWLGWQAGAMGIAPMRFSPLQAVWGLSAASSQGQAAAAIAQHQLQIVSVAAAAVAGWVVLGGLLWWTRCGERLR